MRRSLFFEVDVREVVPDELLPVVATCKGAVRTHGSGEGAFGADKREGCFCACVVSAEGLRDDGVFLWLRDVFRGGTSGKLVYNSADSLLCQCYNSNSRGELWQTFKSE